MRRVLTVRANSRNYRVNFNTCNHAIYENPSVLFTALGQKIRRVAYVISKLTLISGLRLMSLCMNRRIKDCTLSDKNTNRYRHVVSTSYRDREIRRRNIPLKRGDLATLLVDRRHYVSYLYRRLVDLIAKTIRYNACALRALCRDYGY